MPNALLDLLILLSCAYWIVTVGLALRGAYAMRVLADETAPEPALWPRLTIVIPACNEQDSLEAATASRLAEGYPNLELVVVDDRSRDRTAEIAARLASLDPRVRTVRVETLPSGWLGKVHALDVGVRQASGDWLLFCDADVHLAAGTLRRSVAYCEARGLDHLALMPQVWSSGFALDAILATCVRFMCAGARPWSIEDPTSTAAFGVGAFNLVRRTALQQTEGFGGIRMDLADDMALACMLKASGARTSFANGRDLVGLHFYRSVRQMAVGVEKNGFPVVGAFQHWRVGVACIVWPLVELGPFVGAAFAPAPWLRLVCLATALGALAASVVLNRRIRQPAFPALLAPVGSVILAGMLARSSIVAIARGGVMWRGTLYPTELLRRSQRYPMA